MVDIVGSTDAVHKIQKVIDGRHNVALGNRPIMMLQRRGTDHLHPRPLLGAGTDKQRDITAVPKNRVFFLRVNAFQHRFFNNNVSRNDDLAGLAVDQRFRQNMAEHATLPTQFFRQFITADHCQIVPLRIEEQCLQKLLRIIRRRQFAGTQPVINLTQGVFPGRHLLLVPVALTLQRRADQRVMIEKLKNLLIRRISERADEDSYRQFTRSVDTHGKNVVDTQSPIPNPQSPIPNPQSPNPQVKY